MRVKALKISVLVVLAVAIGFGTWSVAQNWLAAERASLEQARSQEVEPEPARQFVLVAAEDVAPGRFVQPDDVRWQAWPDEALPDSYIVRETARTATEDLPEIAGVVTRAAVRAGQPLATNLTVSPGDRGFLAAILQPGMRAVTVSIGDRSGIAGLVHPGDRVDLMLGHAVTLWNEEDQENRITMRISETVVRDVRVIALDRRLGPPGEDSRMPSTATLEVTPRQAEMINLMAQMGDISFALRSLQHTRADGSELPDKRLPLTVMAEPLSRVFTRLNFEMPAFLPSVSPAQSFTVDRDISSVLSIVDDVQAFGRNLSEEGVAETVDGDEIPQLTVSVFRGSAGGAQTTGLSTSTVDLVSPDDETTEPALGGPET